MGIKLFPILIIGAVQYLLYSLTPSLNNLPHYLSDCLIQLLIIPGIDSPIYNILDVSAQAVPILIATRHVYNNFLLSFYFLL